MFEQKYKIRIKKKKSKMTNISHNGPGGCMWKNVVQTEKTSQAQPKGLVFNLQPCLNDKTRAPLAPKLTPDSLTFNKNSQHQ